MRVAAIDVGSNSVRLLVAGLSEGRVEPIARGLITTRLLSGLSGGRLSPESMARTARAVSEHAARARALGASEILAFGTSAMRDAANRDQLIELVRADCGVALMVLSGEQEAQMAYRGAAPLGRAGVIDIGGGSTELLSGLDGRVISAGSAQLGAVRLMEAMAGRLDPEELLAAAQGRLAPVAQRVISGQERRWMGVGGTITTLAALEMRLVCYQPERIEGYRLDGAAVAGWTRKLCGLTLEERAALPGMPEGRADILPYGAAILWAFLSLGRLEAVHASDRDNLEGFLKEKFL